MYGVVGATGNQGSAVVRALQAAGVPVKAFTRDASSAKAKALGDVTLVECDLNDKDSLVEAFQGCSVLFGVTDFWVSCKMDTHTEITHGKNIGDAAKEAGVQHLVMSTLEGTMDLPSAQHIHMIGEYRVPHLDGKGEINDYLESLEFLSLTLVYTCFYLDNVTTIMKPARVPGACGPCSTYMIAVPVPK